VATRGPAAARARRPAAPVRSRPPARRPPARRPARVEPPTPPLARLLLWPVLLTLGVTLLRLAGELRGWSPAWFGRVPGGGLAIVGIAWLTPIVGAWLGYRLGRAGLSPTSYLRGAGLPLLALAVIFVLGAAGDRLAAGQTATGRFAVWGVSSLVGAALALAAWPALGRVLLAYALGARLPVIGVMYLAIQRGWKTHYDAAPPGFPPMLPTKRWLWTGVLPQLTIWVAWTVVLGAFFGALGFVLGSQRRA
jgi:hypothetical protein